MILHMDLEKRHLLWVQARESVGQKSLPVMCQATSFRQLDRQWSTSDKIYHVRVTGVEDDVKSVPFSVCALSSVPPGILTHVLLIRRKAL